MKPKLTMHDDNSAYGKNKDSIIYWEGNRNQVDDLYPSEKHFFLPTIKKSLSVLDVGCAAGGFADIVYEINPEHYKIVQKNISLLGAKNITVRQENIYDNIKEKDLDLITLDLPEPWQVIEHAEKSLKTGGHLVIYLPNLTQVQTFLNATRKSQINPLETIELIERKWKITDKIMRPEFQMLGHTGFLIFCRKLK